MKYLVNLKNPPMIYLVDSFPDKLLKDVPHIKFSQNGTSLIIPTLVTSNITHIKEITDKEAEEWQEAAREANRKATGRIATAQPHFKIPGRTQ